MEEKYAFNDSKVGMDYEQYIPIDFPISEKLEQIEMTEEKCELLPQNENQPLRGKKKQKSASSTKK